MDITLLPLFDRNGNQIKIGDYVWFDKDAYYTDITNGGIPLKGEPARTKNAFSKEKDTKTKVNLYIDTNELIMRVDGLDTRQQYTEIVNI